MTDQLDRRADVTRLQILQAASRQFALRPYGLVNLDDILADAEVTKGAMYFHFRSKHALASAIVEHRADTGRTLVEDLLAQGLSGLETMIDIVFLVAVDDVRDDIARAALNLLESVGRADGLQSRVLTSWIGMLEQIARRAIEEGDIIARCDTETLATALVATYLGLRQTSPIDEPERFLRDLKAALLLMLPGFVEPDRIGYLSQFIERRTAIAIKKVNRP